MCGYEAVYDCPLLKVAVEIPANYNVQIVKYRKEKLFLAELMQQVVAYTKHHTSCNGIHTKYTCFKVSPGFNIINEVVNRNQENFIERKSKESIDNSKASPPD